MLGRATSGTYKETGDTQARHRTAVNNKSIVLIVIIAAMPPEVAPLSSQSRAASSPLGSTERAHDPEFETLQFTGPEAEQSTIENSDKKKTSAYAGLGWLDRLLVLWILLAIVIGILLGNFVDSVGPALQRGKFVDVSVPIGTHSKAYGLISRRV